MAEGDEVTVEQLRDIITAPAGGFTMLPSHDLDEVHPGIYIGDRGIAKSRNTLKKLGITHVLNAAKGQDEFHCNTNPVIYKNVGISYLGLEATDTMNFQIKNQFETATNFIDKALILEGKVLVHCVEGVSRSATLVLAFFMLKYHMPIKEALRYVRQGREICPNDGFLQQLIDVNNELEKKGHFKIKPDLATYKFE